MIVLTFLIEIIAFTEFLLVSMQQVTFGTISVAVQFAMFAILVAARPVLFGHTLLRWWPLLLTPLLATASGLWSSVPEISFRYGAQFLFTAMVGVFLARSLTARQFVLALMLATFVFCILSVLSGREGSTFHGRVIIGLTGSKNAISFQGMLTVLVAITTLMLDRVSLPFKAIAFASIALGMYFVIEAQSSTGVLLTLIGIAAMVGIRYSERWPPGGRLMILVGMALVGLPLLVLAPEAQEMFNRFLYDTLDKDPTLTGRTILWEHANALIAQKPLLGFGYDAIWMGDSAESIGLQRLTGLEDGRTFNFHNTYLQTGTDMGFVGIVTLVLALLVSGARGVWQMLLQPRVELTFFFVYFILTLSRSFTELVIGPFSIHTVLLYACCVYAFAKPAAETAQAPFRFEPPSLRFRRPLPQ